jgi:hypothetical protein
MEMKTKNLMVSLMTFAIALFLVASVSAVAPEFTVNSVEIDGVSINDATVTAGETISVRVSFSSDVDAKKVTVNLELDDVEVESNELIMKAGQVYKKTLTLKVPYDFDDDELENELELELTIEGEETESGDDFELEESYDITVLKPSYNIAFKSINVDSSIEAGETFPVEVVLKNIGYNDLDDMYITASISALGIEKTVYAGDLVSDEWEYDNDDDETDTFSGRIYLEVANDVVPGIYTLEVEVSNDDMNLNDVKQIVIENEFADPVIKSGNDLIIVNPTDNVKVYTVIVESPASVSESIVVVPAGSSRTVTVNPNADGEYNFDVNVLSGDQVVSTMTFSGSDDSKTSLNNPIVVLTVILAIVFLVLLVVLIVLIGKKPEKAEEFGESYY